MKHKIVIFLSLVLISNIKAQITFQKGYVIDIQGVKTECFIRNVDWKKNPQNFKYKLVETGVEKVGDINKFKEFGIDNNSRFIKQTINIDVSSDLQQKLSYEKLPIWENRTLFLRVLITGEANLYSFEDKELSRFFYSIKNGEIKQLIYKRYLEEGTITSPRFNVTYKQQLMNDLTSEKFSLTTFENLSYDKSSFEKLFIAYNQEFNTPQSVIQNNVKRERFAIRLTPGLSYSKLNIEIGNSIIAYQNQLEYRLGCELETILPFNMNKWSIYAEPTFHLSPQRKAESSRISYPEIQFKFITIPIGIKGKSFLKNGDKVFYHTNFDFGFNASFKSKFSNIEINPGNNFAIGTGYEKKKLSIECRYIGNTNLFKKYQDYFSNYSRIQFIIGYKILGK